MPVVFRFAVLCTEAIASVEMLMNRGLWRIVPKCQEINCVALLSFVGDLVAHLRVVCYYFQIECMTPATPLLVMSAKYVSLDNEP